MSIASVAFTLDFCRGRQPTLDPDGPPLQLMHGLRQIGLARCRHFDRSDATKLVADKNWLRNCVGCARATAAAEH